MLLEIHDKADQLDSTLSVNVLCEAPLANA